MQNPEVTRHPNGDPFALDNRFRGGDSVGNVVGVLDYRFGDWKVEPTDGHLAAIRKVGDSGDSTHHGVGH